MGLRKKSQNSKMPLHLESVSQLIQLHVLLLLFHADLIQSVARHRGIQFIRNIPEAKVYVEISYN